MNTIFKLKTISSFLLSVLLLFCGCSNSKKNDTSGIAANSTSVITTDTIADACKIVDIGRKDIPVYDDCAGVKNKLSDIAQSIKFCALANKPLLDHELVADVALTDEDVFVMWKGDAIYRFDRSGAFKNNVGSRGQGPEEYVRLGAPITFDRKNNILYAIDIAQLKLISFDYDGNMLHRFPVGRYDSPIECMDDSTFIVRTQDSQRYRPNTPAIRFMNAKGKIVRTHKSNIYPIKKDDAKNWHFGPTENTLWEHNGHFYSLEYGNDTIYRIENMDMIADRTLSGSKYRPSMYDLYHTDSGGKRILAPLLMLPNSGVFESDRFLILRYYDASGRYFLIYDKTDGKVYQSLHDNGPRREKTGEMLSAYFTDDLVSGMSFTPEYQSNGELIGWLTADDVVKNRDKINQFIQQHPSDEGDSFLKLIENVEEEDNPILMIVKLK